jgi:putative membrane protein
MTDAVTTEPSTGAAVDPGWRRLSRRMLLVHPVQEIPRALPALIGVIIAGANSGHAWWGLASLVIVMAAGLLRWFTTTYRITPDNVQVRKGLVRRQELSVPRDRVRTVDVTANFMHRIVGLTRVEVGTGRTDRKNDAIKLDGLTSAEAARLRVELLHLRPDVVASRAGTHEEPAADAAVEGAQPKPEETELARLKPGWIKYGPFTLSGFVTIGVIGGVVSRAINEAHIDPSKVGPLRAIATHLRDVPIGVLVLYAVAACLLFVAIASLFGYVLAFWGFRLTRHAHGTLHVSRGLLTSRQISIEERRLRGVELSEPLLLRAVGGARCIAIATGLRVGRGAERGGSLLLPPAPRAEAVRVGGAVLRDETPIGAPLAGHGRRALRRRFTRALMGAVILVAIVAVVRWLIDGPAWMFQASLVLIPIALLLAADRARSLGHALSGAWLVTRQGSLVRRRYVLASEGIIGWNVTRSFFQRRAGLATLTATTAAGRQRYDVLDVPVDEAVRLADSSVPGLLTPFLVGRP